MKFNIKTHIIDHAHLVVGNLDKDNHKIIHFNTSVDTSYFIRRGIVTQKEIDEIMSKILQNVLKKELKIKEKNGIYVRKNGTIKQKYRTRIIRFDDMLSAYHPRHFDGSKSVNPHFHFLFSTHARMGKDFLYLKRAIAEEAQKYGLKFNFMEEKRETGLSKNQLRKIESFSWLLQQGGQQKISDYLNDSSRVKATLDLLNIHYRSSQNISYFLKILISIQERLSDLKIDFYYRDINLRENIYFLISERQKDLLGNLAKGRDVRLNLANVLDREILKYAYGFKSDSMEVLKDKFEINDIKKSQLFFKGVSIKMNENPPKSNFRELIIADIRNSLVNAKNEKEWKKNLQDFGYKKIAMKSQRLSNGKRVKIGLNLVTPKGGKVYVPFSEASLTFPKIMRILMRNKSRKKKEGKQKGQVDEYQRKEKKRKEFYEAYTYRVKILLQIYSSDPSQIIVPENLENLAKKYEVIHSKLYRITTFTNRNVAIVDAHNKITLKKSVPDSFRQSISDMLEIAMLKGWKLDSLVIKGDKKFLNEVEKQIKDRLGKFNERSKNVKQRQINPSF